MPGLGVDGLRADLLELQRGSVAGRPAYMRLVELALPALDGWLGELLARAWAARSFSASYERPLMLLTTLRYAALVEGPSHPLHRAFVDSPADVSAITQDAIRATLSTPRVERALRERTIQTNETTRAVAWLWPARLLAGQGALEPFALVDLGTSAGLNLIADALPSVWVDETGAAIEVAPRPPVALRLGIDRSPIDARNEDDACWLRACVWQDDLERLLRLEQGLARMRATAGTADAPQLVSCGLDQVATPLAALPAGQPVILVQTVVRDYLPPVALERYEQAVRAFITERPPLSVLWSQLELRYRDEPFERSMVLSLTLRDSEGGLRELVLARTHPHPRILHIDRAAVAATNDCILRAHRSVR